MSIKEYVRQVVDQAPPLTFDQANRIQCLNCGLQLTDDRAMLKKIADQYQADADHLREVKAQAWQDGHDTALLHGQSQNPHEQEPR